MQFEEGLNERKVEKEKEPQGKEKKITKKDFERKDLTVARIEAIVEEEEKEEEEEEDEDIATDELEEMDSESVIDILDVKIKGLEEEL
jgi:hypothetical protein